MTDPQALALAPPAEPWLSALHPLEAYVLVVGVASLVIAAAQWLASNYTDRRALRLFALRNALAALGWFFANPYRHTTSDTAPLVPQLAAAGLLGLAVFALDEFLGTATPRRRALIAAGIALSMIALWVVWHRWPNDARLIYLLMAASMALCAAMAWRAADREGNVGHRVVSLAFLSYPLLVGGLWFQGPGPAREGLPYLIALPNMLVGVTILVVSLIRAGRRTEIALQERAHAEHALLELNATLEQRVQGRTTELQTMVEGLQSFTRSVSHDLRGPLAGMSGVARLAEEALDRGDVPGARHFLKVIAPQSDRLQSLVEGLLTLSRVGEDSLSRVAQPLSPLVTEALAQLALSPESADDLSRVTVEVDDLPSAAVDAAMLRQVFVNLLGNAVRFSAVGAGAARVHVGARLRGGATEVFVSDSGEGFAPEVGHRLFQPFVLLHGDGLSRNGVGLSIVRRVVERHGGRVWAESRPGAGATFWFSLPQTA